ncbi:MAG: hypothetical protein HXY34_03420 [Candidatus Thorarchaeota archaeon]|nr:hypothetical protein [Candidatus Thorarchaeota archaeon]
MFVCTRCGEALNIRDAELKDKILTMQVQCANGHKSVRRLAQHQAEEMASEVFSRLFICIDCGAAMNLLRIETTGVRTEGLFLCPRHGTVRKEFPREFTGVINLQAADTEEASRSIVESFVCPQCKQTFAISEIAARGDFYQLTVRCANGHRETNYIPTVLDEGLMKRILQRVVHCDRCLLPGKIVASETRGKYERVHAACPAHGVVKKDIPVELSEPLRVAVSEITEDSVVKAMLYSRECRQPLAVTQIDVDRTGYRLRCVCPASTHVTMRILPLEWSEPVRLHITHAVLTCESCGLLTHILDAKRKKDMTEFRVVCPLHGVLNRLVPSDVYGYILEQVPKIDHVPSMIRSFSCAKCRMPLTLRDVEDRRGLIEFDMECQNGHRGKRFFVPGIPKEKLVGLYKNLYHCPECYGPMDLVYASPAGRESRVVLLCSVHGKVVLNIPPDHAEAMQQAYEEIQKDRTKPPVEVSEEEEPIEIEPSAAEEGDAEEGVHVYRGCEIVGGKFDFKVKVANQSPYVITNVTVSIVAYPQDCMELAGETVKTMSRIEVGGFRSPQFTLYPTKDCVQGKIVATVSFIDFRDQLHTIQVEPLLIRSVCDLLKPTPKTTKDFDLLLSSLEKTGQEQTLEWNARVLFTKAEMILPTKNFHLVDAEERTVGEEFIGTLRGFAEGKYTGKKVAVIILIAGPINGRHSVVKVEALGEDVAMLPTTIDELADTMDSWICLRCGGPLEPEQVEELGKRLPIRCQYCSHTLTLSLYLEQG